MRTQVLRRISAALPILAIALAAVACGGKVNQENYAKINNGMSAAEVEAIMGPGTEQASSSVAVPAMPNVAGMPAMTGTPGVGAPGSTVATKVLVWRSGNKMITVTLMNDKVMAKTQFGL